LFARQYIVTSPVIKATLSGVLLSLAHKNKNKNFLKKNLFKPGEEHHDKTKILI
jgi:hypothetical protein